MRIAVVAPSTPIAPETAERVRALAGAAHPGVEIVFAAQCFERHNHFAGTDAARAEAFVAAANDPGFDALWFARGGAPRLLRARLDGRLPEGGTVVVETDYERVGGLDLARRIRSEAVVQQRRRLRVFTVLLRTEAALTDHRVERR